MEPRNKNSLLKAGLGISAILIPILVASTFSESAPELAIAFTLGGWAGFIYLSVKLYNKFKVK